jgi:hypothetical protein
MISTFRLSDLQRCGKVSFVELKTVHCAVIKIMGICLGKKRSHQMFRFQSSRLHAENTCVLSREASGLPFCWTLTVKFCGGERSSAPRCEM